ncbi:hypothetical protein AB0H82_08005 [Streptomyces sp. NPDC050732]|uniref:hypothetical protein n=1 Tax=Streptomyces sp. NPDC050732 TaxID=3154632 RepID=UPI00344269F2
MINFTRVSVYGGIFAIALPVLLLGPASAVYGEALPFPGRGYVSLGGPAEPGRIVDLTVKERPGNPHPTAVSVSSPALTDDTVLGDTGRAWVGVGRIKEETKPGTYDVKFTLRHKDANCVGEGEQDYVCDYPPIVLRAQVKVAATQNGSSFGSGLAVGVSSGAAVVLAAGAVLLRRKHRRAAGETS